MSRHSLRVEQDELRARMRTVGMSHDEIAIEFARRYHYRPRAAHRHARGWTQTQAANHINAHAARAGLDPDGAAPMTGPKLSELETWPLPSNRRRPTPQILALLAEVYDTSIHNLIDLDDREHLPPTDMLLINTARRNPAADPERGSASAPVLADDSGQPRRGEQITMPVVPTAQVMRPADATGAAMPDLDRRDFVTATATALTFGRPALRNVDPALIDYFNQQLEGHYQADMMLGPRELISTVTAQHTLISNLVATGHGGTRRALLGASAAYASLIGWLHQDAGDLPSSSVWRGIALEAAQRSRDHQLVAYALLNHASVRTDLADGLGALDLCGAVLADAGRLSPKMRVLALQQQAHGASLIGDRATVDSVLDQAAPLVERCDDAMPWGNACRRTPAYLEVQRATCYGRLGLATAATGLWQQVLATTPTHARRDRGVYLARQATACVQNGDLGRAVEAGRLAADVAVETGSVRIRRELAGLRQAAEPWKGTAVGRDLDEIFAL
ncbi:hypothetical protein Franean1_2840 [Parafrankia sp. EAN1pec]|uniref:hypothetical protein n=1 Tax=Parafrankia sp. (strain EAN1pec) TaxID=298653 RepID=UPI00015D9D0C|nr:hypothetical protein Franean1_2840 [Frankia sp. EAN1pec]